MTDKMIAKLESKGARRWSKGSADRLYFRATMLGLELAYYKTGNIRDASFRGRGLSNSEGGRYKAASTYVDLKTGEVVSDYDCLADAARELIAAVQEEAGAEDTDTARARLENAVAARRSVGEAIAYLGADVVTALIDAHLTDGDALAEPDALDDMLNMADDEARRIDYYATQISRAIDARITAKWVSGLTREQAETICGAVGYDGGVTVAGTRIGAQDIVFALWREYHPDDACLSLFALWAPDLN